MVRRLLAAVAVPLCAVAILLAPTGAHAHQGVHAEIEALDAKIRARPGDGNLLLERASLHRREGHLSKAFDDLKRASSLAPSERQLFLERGLTHAAAGNSAAAETDLTRFLGSGPASVAALWERGKMREARKQLAAARADYDAALKLRPDPDLFLARGRIDEAQKLLDQAAAGYEEGLRALSGAVVLRLALVRVETARGHYDRAIALIDEAIAAAAVKADWLLLRADVHQAAGRADAALRDREGALREIDERMARHPTDLARVSRAKANLALGRAAEAVRDLEPVVARSPHLEEAAVLLREAKRRAAAGRLQGRGTKPR